MNLGLITLGCTKNQVDSEMMLGFFKEKGFCIVSNSNEADVLIINTCGFIESTKKEAIDTILEMADYKENGKCKHLIVTGCLAKRYKKEIIESIPEVDLVIGVDEYTNIDKILSDYFKRKFIGKLEFNDRIISSSFPMAYIRISDGCDNRCSYCAIPLIRGSFKSRPIEDILNEVKLLASQGISEFVIISQDTTKYGLDIYGKFKLAELLSGISKIDGVKWIRILYMYLYELNDQLLLEMKNNKKICNYFDIPIQHISNKVLKDMNRKDNRELIYSKINKIKEMMPDAILRTTIIVGFPNESDNEFEELLTAIQELKFDRLEAFTYSKEEDTKAFDMDNQINEEVKQDRLDRLLTIQKGISLSNNKNKIGRVVEVLVDNISEDEKYFIARSYMDAPDVDGKILININKKSVEKVILGEYTKVKIIDCSEYDLFAETI
ncbi:MAG: 30S ribosomal protein S12 methylthiotransferase RimO [Clostridia bacterium]|nr:30S ribosomal protein S12 methylthiotransferase RimO [Clostridia bacterium]